MRRGAPARRPTKVASAAAGEGGPGHAAVRAWVRILAVHKRGLASIRDDLEREMTLPRFDLLANLARSDGQTLAALSRSMLVTPGNLTGLVDRAARDGMVERRADPSDRRAWRIHVTPKGLRAFRAAERRHASRVARLFAPLSTGELESLVRLLDKVRDQLRAAEAGPSRPHRAVAPRTLREPATASPRRRARAKA